MDGCRGPQIQLDHMSYRDRLSNQNGGDLMTVPVELLYEIICHLQAKDIIKLCRTSKHFNGIICQGDFDYLWKYLYQRDIDLRLPGNANSSDGQDGHGNSADPKREYFSVMTEFYNLSPSDNGSPRAQFYPQIEYAVKNNYHQLLEGVLKDYPSMMTWALICSATYDRKEILDEMFNRCHEVMTVVECLRVLNDALVEASSQGHASVVDKLLKQGANNVQEAIQKAAIGNHQEVIILLNDFNSANF